MNGPLCISNLGVSGLVIVLKHQNFFFLFLKMDSNFCLDYKRYKTEQINTVVYSGNFSYSSVKKDSLNKPAHPNLFLRQTNFFVLTKTFLFYCSYWHPFYCVLSVLQFTTNGKYMFRFHVK